MSRITLGATHIVDNEDRRWQTSAEPAWAHVTADFHPDDLADAQAAFDRCVAEMRRKFDILAGGAQ